MQLLLLVAAFAHVVTCGNVAVRMPFINPAGVTYVDGAYHSGLAAGPLAYHQAQPFLQAAPVHYAPAHVAPVAPVAQYHAPLAYQHHVKYAPVPTVHHVQGAVDVPVTRYEAQPAVIQKLVDVAKPAIKTRKFEIRRPAIQKQFYDIEERVVVRPAGSALVELEEPLSKSQKGAALIQPAAVAVPAVHHAVHAVPAVHHAVHAVPAVPAYARLHYAPAYGVAAARPWTQVQYPGLVNFPGAPAQIPQPAQPQPQPQPTPAPQQEQPIGPEPQPQFDDDSVAIDNPEVRFRSNSGPSSTPSPIQEQQVDGSQPQPSASPAPEQFQQPQQPQQLQPQPQQPQPQARSGFQGPQGPQGPQARSFGPSPFIVNYPNSLDLVPQARYGGAVVPSVRNLPEISQANQQRLIQLLTARGGVTEVGLGRAGPAISPVGDAGQIRARVLSATPAPAYSEPAGERVNTRRVVVSRPIETLQEIEVSEPVTKIERIQVDHPTLIKSARQDIVRVPTSVPVYGKALAPVAHAAVPVAHAHPVAPAYASHLSYYG